MNTFTLDVVTPNGSVYSAKEVELVVLHTETGEMGVMAGHIPTVAALKTGYVKVNKASGTEYLAVSEGFVEVRANKVTVLVQSAETAEEIDKERAINSKERAEERLNSNQDEVDFRRAERALHRAVNRIEVAKFR
ncbi:F0F1 ATP synthase subunit epsilon [Mammaliicoccus vitulinus]|uniref:F0F1 ATP synthase subunit epsilon n=1 Tax=Mammaliicoccus vitulinus TaxID=71237 RepID=UPI003B9E6BE8